MFVLKSELISAPSVHLRCLWMRCDWCLKKTKNKTGCLQSSSSWPHLISLFAKTRFSFTLSAVWETSLLIHSKPALTNDPVMSKFIQHFHLWILLFHHTLGNWLLSFYSAVSKLPSPTGWIPIKVTLYQYKPSCLNLFIRIDFKPDVNFLYSRVWSNLDLLSTWGGGNLTFQPFHS